MAGWKTEQILTTVRHTMNLATASKSDFIQVADYISDDMTAMNLTAGQDYTTHSGVKIEAAQYMHDAYAYALTQSNLNLDALHEAMKYSAPIASEWGLSVAEQLATLMGAADSGIKGSMAGTGMRAGLLRLTAPPKAAAAALSQMGMSMSDAMKEFHEAQAELQGMDVKVGDFKTTITNLVAALDKLSPGERLAKINAIFGRNAATFWAKLLSPKNAHKFLERMQELEGGVKDWAADTADVMRNSTVGAFKILESSWDAVKTSFGDALLPTVRSVVDSISPLLMQLSFWIDYNPQIVQGITAIVAVLGGLTVAIAGVAVAFAGWELITAQLAAFRAGMIGAEVATMSLAFRMGSAFTALSATLTGAFASLRAVTWGGLFSGLMAQIAAARVAVTGFFASLSLSSIASAVVTRLSAVGSAILSVGRAAMAFAFSPVGAALMLIALAAYAIYTNWSKLAPIFSSVGSAIMTALGAAGNAIGNLIQSIGTLFGSVFESLNKLGAGDTIIRVFLMIVNNLAGVAVSILNIFSSVVNTVAHMFEGLGKAISAALEGEFTDAAAHMSETLSHIQDDWKNIHFSKLDFGYDIGANYQKSLASYQNAVSNEKGLAAAKQYENYSSGITAYSAPAPPAESSAAPPETAQLDTSNAQAQIDSLGQAAENAGQVQSNVTQNIEAASQAFQQTPQMLQPVQESFANFPATLEPLQTALQGIGEVAGLARDNIQQLGDKSGAAYGNVELLGEKSGAAYGNVEKLGSAAGNAFGNVDKLGGAAGSASGQVSGMGTAADNVAGALQTAATRIANIQITAPTISATPVTPAGLYTGGIYNKGAFLTWFAERAPEAAIPLDKSKHAVNLWTQAGQMLGVLPADGSHKITKPSTDSKRTNIINFQKSAERHVNQLYNSVQNLQSQQITEMGRVIPYNPLPEEVQERSKIPPPALTERQRYASKDWSKERTLERIRNSRSYQALSKATPRTAQNSTSILNKPEQFDLPTDFLKIGGFDLGKIPFIGGIVSKFESWLTEMTGMQPVDVYNKFINRKNPQIDATQIMTQTGATRRGLDTLSKYPVPLSPYPSPLTQDLTERVNTFSPLEDVTPSVANSDYSAATFQPTININVTVHTDGSPSSIRDVGEKIAYSARESFEKMFESFLHDKARRSFA